MAVPSSRLLLIALVFLVVSAAVAHTKSQGRSHDGGKHQLETGPVTYDGRSLLINGKRELLFSGSIHYTRSTPEMWPDLLRKAKYGGLNVIQTYVFWNIHEPVKGQYNFSGNYDLVRFIKLVQEHGMYVTLRVGPFIQAEWNHGGLPYWLREVPNLIFRTDNAPYKYYMKKYVTMIVNKLKEAKLFFAQGGPIILAQIENEYDHIQLAYKDMGFSYVRWAARMAVKQNVGVPWIMCKQTDAPDPVINTCNGRHCGDTFSGPNKPYKPALWTENWTAQYRVFGDPASQRPAEDIAFSVARFFSKNGALTNYYMYHGGTNFGRTSAIFTTTRYYDEAPLDEYGLPRDPKWSHLKDLHKALRLSRKPLLWGVPGVQNLGENLEARFYELKNNSKICAAFLANNNSRSEAIVNWRGQDYYLPPHSISILPDCKTVVYNTQTIVSQHNARNIVRSTLANKMRWMESSEPIPSTVQVPITNRTPLELYSLLKDQSDYAWYTTSLELNPRDMSMKESIQPVLRIGSLGHAMLVFVNGEYVGSGHGSHDEKSFVFQKVVSLKAGVNQIALLAMTVGLPDSGAYMEHRYAGPKEIEVLGLNTGTIDLSRNGWGHQVGLNGEKIQVFTEEGSKRVQWGEINEPKKALTWYKTYFDAPEGNDPVAIKMSGMGKGMMWVNGESIGRHWMSFLSPLGQPTQSEYHIPRSFIKPTQNLLIVLEEEPAKPNSIEIMIVNRDTICSFITEYHPPNVKSWARENSLFRPVLDVVRTSAELKCPNYKKVVEVEFASFGDPVGSCGSYTLGKCDSPVSKEVVEQHCLNKTSCIVPIDRKLYFKNNDDCPDIKKTLAIQVNCA
ncbi:beta-galactosidase 13-like [Rosa rugosa]|uniref:beta-galactosidase 13-like n=1 Tax=Rosa rugosa TaxID=74645 RepID=UPI002B40A6FF|nr:beta-galactosidase 13-like [Rosa rugosa]